MATQDKAISVLEHGVLLLGSQQHVSGWQSSSPKHIATVYRIFARFLSVPEEGRGSTSRPPHKPSLSLHLAPKRTAKPSTHQALMLSYAPSSADITSPSEKNAPSTTMQEFAISSQVCPSSHLTFVAHSDEKPVIPRGLGYRGPSISAGAKHVARGHHRPTQSHLEVFSSAERPHTTSRGQGVPPDLPSLQNLVPVGSWHGSPKDTKGDTSWNLLCNTVHILHLFKATSLSLPTHHWNTRERTPPCHVSLKTKMKEKSRGGNPAKHVISSSIHRAGVARETDTQPSPAQQRKKFGPDKATEGGVCWGSGCPGVLSPPDIFS